MLALDEEFVPVPLSNSTGQEFSTGVPDTYVLRGTVSSESDIKQLEKDPRVVKVWTDTVIGPFGKAPKKKTADQSSAQQMNRSTPMLDDNLAAGACPIGTCDCDPNLARGTIADVARYLGVDQIWNQGYRGAGIVVGVVDGGITAQGRAVKPGKRPTALAGSSVAGQLPIGAPRPAAGANMAICVQPTCWAWHPRRSFMICALADRVDRWRRFRGHCKRFSGQSIVIG